jgi:hypothetical protein
MLARLLALVIALSTGATGVLPVGDGYRCLVMKQRVAPGADCCAACERTPRSIGRPCCEYVRGAVADARAPHSIDPPRLAPAPLVAVLPLGALLVAGQSARAPEARPRGQPPGDQLHRFSQILRV